MAQGIDLRSDTVTKPSEAMKQAMMAAPLGDDVYAEDPTVKALEERVADLCGKEAGLFLPSGTMSNQVACGIHLRPGDEVLGHPENHVFVWEAGGLARHWGATYRPIVGANPTLGRQMLAASDFAGLLRPDDAHYVRTRLVCLESTLNRGGGRVYPPELCVAIGHWARSHGLRMHLDGARLWNAAVARGVSLAELAEPFDTVSLCLSKGLGCPVGSVLVGSREHRCEGLRLRKLLGGAMRQAGILAAAGLFAIEHQWERLQLDHEKARRLYEAIGNHPYCELEGPLETNLVWFRLGEKAPWDAFEFSRKFKEQGILITAFNATTLRAVTHLDVSEADVEAFCRVLSALR